MKLNEKEKLGIQLWLSLGVITGITYAIVISIITVVFDESIRRVVTSLYDATYCL